MPKDCRPFRFSSILLATTWLVAGAAAPVPAASFVNFEAGQVRPLAMSPDQTRLFAVNTPDDRLEIFTVGATGALTHTGSVAVGLEPVAVAARSDGEVWVVNHLSDSISVVDVSTTPPHVARTILTCDEPRDVVFAGGGRAFVTAAYRGQNCSAPGNYLITAGVGRAVVQVYDPANLGTTLAGTPVTEVILFGDSPRALATSADGNTVYAAIFESGNQTTTIGEGAVCDGGATASPCGAFPGGLPAPNSNVESILGPEVGLITKFNLATSKWEDELGRDWSPAVKFDLPDLDVFAIDAAAAVPVQTASFAHVGTILFDMVTNPVSGKVYVSNTEARNEVRFEGPGLAFNSTTVQGHLHEARITVIDQSGPSVTPRHLNKHIDYSQRPAPAGVKEKSLATPTGLAITADGTTLYVAGFGSSKVGVFDTAALEDDSFVPSAGAFIPVSGGGPTGLLLDETRDRLYVFTRFDNAISVVDATSRAELSHVHIPTPEPASVLNGRRFLYDADYTSSNGEASCSSCHIFGDFDSLAWDLGNPDDVVLNNPLPVKIPAIFGTFEDFHPLKGPMTTQSLRGMANHGSMHWRGDRTGGNDPGGDSFDEDAAFKKFNPAFVGLVGRDTQLDADEMQAFTDFILGVTYPPNPVRRFDGTFTTNEQAGHDLFFGRITDTLFNCDGCHTLDRSQGLFGSSAFSTFEGETQMFKVPHLRNAYTKVGMFGRPSDAPRGPQIRGFGFLHDGSIDTIRRFLGAGVFTLTNQEQNQLERFVLAMDSNMAPVVGQQTTLTSTSPTSVGTRIDLLLARAALGECDVVVKGTIAGEPRGGYRRPDGTFQMDRTADIQTDATLRTFAATVGQEITYTCVPVGSGARIGVDRDQDGFLDGDERDVNSDPADAASIPSTPIRATSLSLRDDDKPPITLTKRKVSFRSAKYHGSPSGIVVPAWDAPGDPTLPGSAGGAFLTIYAAGGGSDKVVIPLPASQWVRVGSVTRPGYKYVDKLHVAGPIIAATLRNGALSLRGNGPELYPLTHAPQGTVGVRLKLGKSVGFCTAAPAKIPALNNDTTGKFTGTRNTPAPALCPVGP